MTDDALVTEVVHDLLTDLSGFDAVQQAEVTGEPGPLWDAFAEAGLSRISLPEDAGGSGGSLSQAFAVLRVVGRHAAPIPAAEAGVLGGWLLTAAGLELPSGMLTVAEPRHTDLTARRVAEGVELTGAVGRVPWGRCAETVALLVQVDGEPVVVALPVGSTAVTPRTNLAGEPRDDLALDAVAVPSGAVRLAPAGATVEQLTRRGALARASLMAGALEEVSRLTTQYAKDRHQFGRPIATFQAVSQHLVRVAEHAACARVAAEVAAQMSDGEVALLPAAASKVTAGEAAGEVSARSHQVHGAMGMTREYRLHHLTRRLWAWRQEWGSDEHWAELLGRRVLADGADQLWPTVTTGLRAG
jgi:acyl-CoA dehydrogenase